MRRRLAQAQKESLIGIKFAYFKLARFILYIIEKSWNYGLHLDKL